MIVTSRLSALLLIPALTRTSAAFWSQKTGDLLHAGIAGERQTLPVPNAASAELEQRCRAANSGRLSFKYTEPERGLLGRGEYKWSCDHATTNLT